MMDLDYFDAMGDYLSDAERSVSAAGRVSLELGDDTVRESLDAALAAIDTARGRVVAARRDRAQRARLAGDVR
ncbi:hypothetical protein IU487_32925 [Nocardia puris]|uniref:hypothetical protein n=1 Tax=Nocardia puris TaxID=208602 RepID=UPI001894983E|nr:hypothetical protein [Nocardia puris]MBF6215804.1 hypothetical protein [Nocardia puris]